MAKIAAENFDNHEIHGKITASAVKSQHGSKAKSISGIAFYRDSACSACRARYWFNSYVRPSVRPSVQCRYCA